MAQRLSAASYPKYRPFWEKGVFLRQGPSHLYYFWRKIFPALWAGLSCCQAGSSKGRNRRSSTASCAGDFDNWLYKLSNVACGHRGIIAGPADIDSWQRDLPKTTARLGAIGLHQSTYCSITQVSRLDAKLLGSQKW